MSQVKCKPFFKWKYIVSTFLQIRFLFVRTSYDTDLSLHPFIVLNLSETGFLFVLRLWNRKIIMTPKNKSQPNSKGKLIRSKWPIRNQTTHFKSFCKPTQFTSYQHLTSLCTQLLLYTIGISCYSYLHPVYNTKLNWNRKLCLRSLWAGMLANYSNFLSSSNAILALVIRSIKNSWTVWISIL